MSISTEVDRGEEGAWGRRGGGGGDLKALMYCQSKARGQSNHKAVSICFLFWTPGMTP